MDPFQKDKAVFGEDHADHGYRQDELAFIDQTRDELALWGINPDGPLTPSDLFRAYDSTERTCAVDVVGESVISNKANMFNVNNKTLIHIKPPNSPCFTKLASTLVACLRVGQPLAFHLAGSCPHWPAIQVEYDQSLVPGQAKTENAAEDRNKT